MKPLVAPGEELGREEVQRYSRHLLLPGVGSLGQRRLKAARVLVVGAGGLGSPVLTYLAAAGVGTIGVIDDDVVELSNLQRQVVHGGSAPGTPKVESAATAIAGINPLVSVVEHGVRLTPANALDLFTGYDLVVDGTDTFATRYLVSDACAVLGLPCVWGSVLRFDGQVSVFWSAPEDAAPVTYRDLHPEPPPAGLVPSCAEGGVLGVVCAAIGAAMAAEVVKLVCGMGEPLLGRLMVFDALSATWSTLRVRASTAPATALRDDYEAWCGVPVPPEDGEIGAADLAAMLGERARGERDFVLVDVREADERAIVGIPGAEAAPMAALGPGLGPELVRLAAGRPLVLHCKSGGRSSQALAVARGAGLDAVHLRGGVLAWVAEVDPSLPRY